MLLYQRPWTRQPQTAREASAWAIERGVQLLTTSDMRYDAATGRGGTYTASSGAHSKKAIRAGIGTTTTAGAASVNYARNAIGNSDCTLIFIGNPGTATKQQVLSQTGAAGDCWLTCNGDENSTGGDYISGQLVLGLLQTGVNRSSIKVAGAIDGTLSAFVIRKRGATGAAWKNGVSQTVVTTGTLAGSPCAAADTVRVCGNSADGAYAFVDTLVLAGIFNTALPDTECAALSKLTGAWRVFAPLQERMWMAAVAAGGGSVTGPLINFRHLGGGGPLLGGRLVQ